MHLFNVLWYSLLKIIFACFDELNLIVSSTIIARTYILQSRKLCKSWMNIKYLINCLILLHYTLIFIH